MLRRGVRVRLRGGVLARRGEVCEEGRGLEVRTPSAVIVTEGSEWLIEGIEENVLVIALGVLVVEKSSVDETCGQKGQTRCYVSEREREQW